MCCYNIQSNKYTHTRTQKGDVPAPERGDFIEKLNINLEKLLKESGDVEVNFKDVKVSDFGHVYVLFSVCKLDTYTLGC